MNSGWHIVKQADDCFVIQRHKRSGGTEIHSRFAKLQDAKMVLFSLRINILRG